MKIRKKFLQLTRFTYPYGTERSLEQSLPAGYKIDKFGNYYLSIGDNYTTMFTCHLDTACKEKVKVNHRFFGQYIITDGKSILGADDKAGMIVLLYMIEKNIPGLYYFFIGEEVGCIGSSDLADELSKDGDVPVELKNINKVISFDRRGTDSVITDQFYGTCCSDEFAKDLCSKLNNTSHGLKMRPDDTGVLTDSAQFMSIIPECTNISVGYYNEHTTKEKQDINHLYRLCRSVVEIDWEKLPVVREPSKNSYYGWDDWWGGGHDYRTYDEPLIDRSIDVKPNKDNYAYKSNSDLADYSEKYYTYTVGEDGISKRAYISQTWLNHEKLLISDMLKKQGRDVDDIIWDGTTLMIRESGSNVQEYIGSRSDLVQFIDTIGRIPVAHLKYDLVFVD